MPTALELINQIEANQKPTAKDLIAQIEADKQPQEKPYTWKDSIMDALVGAGGISRNLPLSDKIKQVITNVTDTTLRGVGMGVGAIVGNSVMPVSGGLAGAAMGQAAGGSVADIIASQLGQKDISEPVNNLYRQAQDALSGATWEGIGQSSVPVIGAIGRGVKKGINYLFPTKKAAQNLAIKQLEPILGKIKEQPFANNLREAEKIGNEIGTDFTIGQATNLPSAIIKERALARSVPGGADIDQLKIAGQNKVIADYLAKINPHQGDVGDLIKSTTQYSDDLTKQLKQAQRSFDANIAQLNTNKPPYTSGETLRNTKYALIARQRPVISKLFDKIPNNPVDVSIIADKVDDIEKFIVEHPEYRPEDIPTNVLSRIKNIIIEPFQLPVINTSGYPTGAIKNTGVPFQTLRGERNNLYRAYDKAASNLPPSDRLLQKLNELKGAFEQTLGTVGESDPEAAKAYKHASEWYKKYYLPLKQGVSREMTSKNVFGEFRIDTEKIPGKIFNSVTDAKQFMSTLPPKEAKQAMKDYATYNLINTGTIYHPQTGEINPAGYNKWLNRNKEVLQELGVYKDFGNFENIITNLEVAKVQVADFNKSIASKLLNVNADKAIAKVFSGTNRQSSFIAMNDLVNQIKGMPESDKAVNGLKKSFSDFYVQQGERSIKDIAGQPLESIAKGKNFLRDYLPAIKRLYQDEPKKINALLKVNRAYELMQRNQTTPFSGGGSPTAENLYGVTSDIIKKSLLKRFIPGYGNLENFGEQKANAYLLKALHDPDYAYSLIYGSKNPKIFNSVITGRLISMGFSPIKDKPQDIKSINSLTNH